MMPKVIGNDSLIARVNEVQGCMYRQSNELGRLNKAVRRYKEENTKLRVLVETMHGDMREMLDTIDKSSDAWGFCRYYGECLDCAERIMRELGIEVD